MEEADSGGDDRPRASRNASGEHRTKPYPEDTDNRRLWDSESKYDAKHVRSQHCEARYMFIVLVVAVIGLVTVAVGGFDRLFTWAGLSEQSVAIARRYEWLSFGGLLGGVVYSAKWLYHSIAKGLWHEDRKVWRYLSPWISLGTTVGIGALLIAGFMKSPVGTGVATDGSVGSTYIGMGFLVGYFSDMFLAKMKEVTQVLFGETEAHFKKTRDSDRAPH